MKPKNGASLLDLMDEFCTIIYTSLTADFSFENGDVHEHWPPPHIKYEKHSPTVHNVIRFCEIYALHSNVIFIEHTHTLGFCADFFYNYSRLD